LGQFEPIWALGLMSGTSLDGVDGAMLMTNGQQIHAYGDRYFRAYSTTEQATLKAALGLWPQDDADVLAAAEDIVLAAHIEVIERFKDAQIVGFHGQTLAHDPQGARTHQLGDGAALAKRTGKKTVWDFRSADMKQGGQGAPLAPFYHHAIARQLGLKRPVAFVNLGGVGNVSLVDGSKFDPSHPDALLAFDTGPANAPINDLMQEHFGKAYDKDGAIAATGSVDTSVLEQIFKDPYFELMPPKSLDRNSFDQLPALLSALEVPDAIATATGLAAASIYAAQMHFKRDPSRWLICGGGRHNTTLMQGLKNSLSAPVDPVEALGLDGDMLEAQAFAYLAVRVLYGLPTSAPTTTGCKIPVCGGQISTP